MHGKHVPNAKGSVQENMLGCVHVNIGVCVCVTSVLMQVREHVCDIHVYVYVGVCAYATWYSTVID